jgi:hypothetical protein
MAGYRIVVGGLWGLAAQDYQDLAQDYHNPGTEKPSVLPGGVLSKTSVLPDLSGSPKVLGLVVLSFIH